MLRRRPEEGRERGCLLRGDLHAEDEGLRGAVFVVRHGAALEESFRGSPAPIPRLSVFRQTHPKLRILVAEDETIIRLDLRALLEHAGFEVCAEARDGEEAVLLARSERPDLALLDVKMPKLDGIEAARRILDERPIPIVMLTAYGQDELVQRAAEAGVFGYLVKPFREQDLLPAIRTARARHEELAALREEAESLAEALAARKAIERAKGLLMEKEGLSEGDAFARLRKASQISGRPLKVVAEALIATLEG
jgi:two-component system, response regulator PdtaR